ncbi:MAG TPA: ABC transporter substrate-binding protein, partial [Thermodesulfobacteriota bacterium]|nr:ABC transporter substrate-binding protein [Thermodesulfobacteriota bacterium]
PEMAVRFAKAAKKAGVRLPLIGGSELHTGEFLKGGDLVAGSIIYSGFSPDDTDPAAKEFISSYTRRYGHAPDEFSADGYDTFMMLASALKNGGSTRPDTLKEAIIGIKGFKGVTGTIEMGPGKEAARPAYLLKAVRNGGKTAFLIVKSPHEK